MLQAAILDCSSLDPFSIDQDFLATPEVDVSWFKIVQALMIAPMIVVLDELFDIGFEIAWQIVVFQ